MRSLPSPPRHKRDATTRRVDLKTPSSPMINHCGHGPMVLVPDTTRLGMSVLSSRCVSPVAPGNLSTAQPPRRTPRRSGSGSRRVPSSRGPRIAPRCWRGRDAEGAVNPVARAGWSERVRGAAGPVPDAGLSISFLRLCDTPTCRERPRGPVGQVRVSVAILASRGPARRAKPDTRKNPSRYRRRLDRSRMRFPCDLCRFSACRPNRRRRHPGRRRRARFTLRTSRS
jgi:hypothetical protein